MSSDGSNDGNVADGRNRNPRKTRKRTKTYWPFRWLQHLVRDSQREDAQRNQKRNYKNLSEADLLRSLRLAERLTSRPAAVSAMIFFAGLIGVALLFWTGAIFDDKGNPDPNWIIAIFTLVMALTTLLQWTAVQTSNSEFGVQNEIMRDQIDHMRVQNTEMASQNEQTGRMIEVMRNERRAWVGLESPRIVAWDPTGSSRFAVTMRNTGLLPAVVNVLETRLVICTFAEFANELRTFGARISLRRRGRTRITVPPAGFHHQPITAGTTDETLLRRLDREDHRFFLIVALSYSNGVDDTGYTQFAYIRQRDPGNEGVFSLVIHREGSEMR